MKHFIRITTYSNLRDNFHKFMLFFKHYLIKARGGDLPIWLWASWCGLFFSQDSLSLNEQIQYFMIAFLVLLQVLLCNDWGGLVRDQKEYQRYHPNISRRFTRMYLGWGTLVLTLITILYSYLLVPSLMLLVLLVVLSCTLYSHPKTHWKTSPVYPSIVHFTSYAAMFLLTCDINSLDGEKLLFALQFGLIFTGCLYHHEAQDFLEDRDAGHKTNAHRWGERSGFLIGYLMMLLSQALLLVGVILGYVGNIHLLAIIPLFTAIVISGSLFLLRPERISRIHIRAFHRIFFTYGNIAIFLRFY